MVNTITTKKGTATNREKYVCKKKNLFLVNLTE